MSSDCSYNQRSQKNDDLPGRSKLCSIENEENSGRSKSIHNTEGSCIETRTSPCLLKSCKLYCSHTPSPSRRSSRRLKPSTVPILVFNTWPNPRLSHCIEDDDDDDETWSKVQPADKLHGKLQCATCSVTCMQQRMRELRHDYEELEDSTSHLLAEAQHLVADLRDVRNLEILLQLQNGNLKNLPLQKWPFAAMAQNSSSSSSTSPDINLIV